MRLCTRIQAASPTGFCRGKMDMNPNLEAGIWRRAQASRPLIKKAPKPLFGRSVGTFYIPDHTRGPKDQGEVIKRYQTKGGPA